MEAEYVAACEASKEAIWLRKFLKYLEDVPNVDEPMSHKRSKHIERKYHLIREIVQRGDVEVK